MIREYPDTRQSGDYNCGEAVVDGVFSFKGVRSSAVLLGLANDADGMHPSTLYAVLRKAGLCLQSGTFDTDDLKYHTNRERPVLCPIDLYGGHWVTVLGVTPMFVHYHCPVDGRRRVAREEFERVWRDSTREGHPFDHWGIVVL